MSEKRRYERRRQPKVIRGAKPGTSYTPSAKKRAKKKHHTFEGLGENAFHRF